MLLSPSLAHSLDPTLQKGRIHSLSLQHWLLVPQSWDLSWELPSAKGSCSPQVYTLFLEAAHIHHWLIQGHRGLAQGLSWGYLRRTIPTSEFTVGWDELHGTNASHFDNSFCSVLLFLSQVLFPRKLPSKFTAQNFPYQTGG